MVSVLKADEEPDKNSLQVIKAAWAIRDCAISEFLHDLTDHQGVLSTLRILKSYKTTSLILAVFYKLHFFLTYQPWIPLVWKNPYKQIHSWLIPRKKTVS